MSRLRLSNYLSGRQLAGMGDFPVAHRAHLRGFQSGHRGGFSVQRCEFHFVGEAVIVNVNHVQVSVLTF